MPRLALVNSQPLYAPPPPTSLTSEQCLVAETLEELSLGAEDLQSWALGGSDGQIIVSGGSLRLLNAAVLCYAPCLLLKVPH